ncbi:MAG: SHOCT domain-containing protein [Burkholderiales bacterium]|nr:SHOCT domain-containing protein [Burkholderiales bacterium]
MQHTFTTRLGLFALSLFAAVSVCATDLKPWSEGDDYVRLDPVNANNTHPATFSPDQLRNLLARFYKKEGSKESVPYFTQDEQQRLSEMLQPIFVKAQASDDVLFGSSNRPGNFLLTPRVLNAGRLFVAEGYLNIVIGMCAEAQDMNYQAQHGRARALNHGSRIKPASDLSCELVAQNGAERVDNRPDWLRLPITQETVQPVPVPQPKTGTSFLPFLKWPGGDKPAAAPAPVATPAVASPATAAPVTQPKAPRQEVLPLAPTNKLEERMQLLKRLHDNGLITNEEYDQKRAALLKEL